MAKKIVITGGPCGGKSSALSFLKTELEAEGFKVFIATEAATFLFNAGIERTSPDDFQRWNLRMILQLEDILEQASAPYGDKAVILCDRGIMDGAAYTSPEAFADMTRAEGLTPCTARDRYDGVFHLVTTAIGAEDAYTTANNAARFETLEQAREVDLRTLTVWVGHPHLRILDNRGNFQDKLQRLLDEINGVLGYPVPKEIERRFLIRRPSDEQLAALPACRSSEIRQTYCTRADGSHFRLRRRGYGADCYYTLNEKERVSDLTRIEHERRLTLDEYTELMAFADADRRTIVKERTCLAWNGTYYEIDRFPFWQKQAMLEVELLDEAQPVTLPPFFELIREVTDDRRYNNSALAAKVPEEE